MKPQESVVVGFFPHLDALLGAIAALQAAGVRELQALSPVPRHEIDEALGARRSPVRVFTLLGGLAGCATGFALTIGAALHYPLIVGGKPLISIPPFVVIAYELTILLGALGTLVGLLLSAGLPRLRPWPGYDPGLASTCFGLQVRCPSQQIPTAEAQMRAAGAQEVRRVEG